MSYPTQNMTADEYARVALSTEATPVFIGDPTKPMFIKEQLELSKIVHAALGLCTEVGEFQDAIKKHLMYGKPLDKLNLVEEIGDILWYCALALHACDSSFSKAQEMNLAKLRARYNGKFTGEKALNRDLEKERHVLEDSARGGHNNE